MCDPSLPDVSLPSGWASNVKTAVLHVISLAQYAMVTARGWAANSLNARVRLTADNNQFKQENQWLCEGLRIENARLAKIDPRRRPHYPAVERMAILELKAARGWSLAQAARAFLVEPDTIASWLRRCRDDGENGQGSRGRGKQGRRSARIANACRQTRHSGRHPDPKTPGSSLNRSRRMVADPTIADRIVRKADGGRRPEAIREKRQ